MTKWSAKGGARSSLHYGGEGVLIHPPHQGVCTRHGTEELCVTPGELAWSAGGTVESEPISESEVASDAASVVGLPSSTSSAMKVARPSNRRASGPGKAADVDGWDETEQPESRAWRWNSSMSENTRTFLARGDWRNGSTRRVQRRSIH